MAPGFTGLTHLNAKQGGYDCAHVGSKMESDSDTQNNNQGKFQSGGAPALAAILLLFLVSSLAWGTPEERRFAARAEGGRHYLAIDAAGRVWAWGENSAGQLGTGSFRGEDQAVLLTGPQKTVAVAAGLRHSLALAADGRVWVWGAGQFGQTGKGGHDHFTSQPLPLELKLPLPVKAIAAGDHHNLALDIDGRVWAWGANDLGQLGDGSLRDSGEPRKVPFKGKAARIFAKGKRSGLLSESGEALTWGGVSRNRAEKKPTPISLKIAWFNEAPPKAAPETAPVALAPVKMPELTAAPQSAAQTKVVAPPPALPAPASPPKAATPPVQPTVALPPAPAAGAPHSPPPPSPAPIKAATNPSPSQQPETLIVRGRVLIRTVGSLRGLAGVEVRAGNTDCSPSDGDGWYECRVPYAFSGAIHPRKAKYRFSPSAVSLDKLQTDLDGQQFFIATYEPF